MPVDIVALGEPMLEFNATEPGSLRDIRNYEVGWGGDTSNFVVAVSRLGRSAGYICRLGDDGFGKILLDLWKHEGVDASQVILDTHAPTGIYFISRHGETHSFTYYRSNSAASLLSVDDIPEVYLEQAKVFHTSGISQAISNSACDAVFYAIEVAREAGALISYDPNVRLKLWDRERAQSTILETIRMADFVFPSLEDAQLITGLNDPDQIASDLQKLGPKVVALKLGEQGALLATQDGLHRIEPFEVDVKDTTGAGDAFAGAFIVAYLDGLDPYQCGRFANAAAALTCTDLGAVKPIPSRKKVEELLRQ
ncbi:MAG TPA: sugar kinase [Anaerolineae bacterium]|nr:sugar kinase [Anaerolineae bacterium]